MALGPIPGTDLGPDEVGTLLGWATCRVCKGRGWVWMSIVPPEATPSGGNTDDPTNGGT